MSDEDVLQGDDPTLIAIIASAHGYYVDQFEDAPIEAVPLMTQPLVYMTLRVSYRPDIAWAIRDNAWFNATFGFQEAA